MGAGRGESRVRPELAHGWVAKVSAPREGGEQEALQTHTELTCTGAPAAGTLLPRQDSLLHADPQPGPGACLGTLFSSPDRLLGPAGEGVSPREPAWGPVGAAHLSG